MSHSLQTRMVFYFILSSSSMNVQNSESICVIVCKLVKAPPYKLQDDHCSFYDIVYPEKDTQINHHDFMKAPIIRQSHEQWQNLGHCTHRKKLSFNQAISLFSAIFFCDKVFSDHNTQIAVTTKKGQIGEQALQQLKGVGRKVAHCCAIFLCCLGCEIQHRVGTPYRRM